MPSIEANAAHHFVDRHLADGRGAAVAFIDGSGAHTYADLARLVNQSGNLLRNRGVSRSDRELSASTTVSFSRHFSLALSRSALYQCPLTPCWWRKITIL